MSMNGQAHDLITRYENVFNNVPSEYNGRQHVEFYEKRSGIKILKIVTTFRVDLSPLNYSPPSGKFE
jgi:hypothetical protein